MDNRDGHTEETKFFTGTEVEHSPMFGQKTLFVVGLQNPKEILARALNNNCPHIYLGANQSFNPSHTSKDPDDQSWRDWDFLVMELLKNGIWVTLDYDIKYHPIVLDYGFTEYDTFIPMISVKLPYIQQLGYNATIKIDDTGFKESNPGVWTHRVHDLMDRKVFTDWTKYTKDEVID
jgi:hypothetical protein